MHFFTLLKQRNYVHVSPIDTEKVQTTTAATFEVYEYRPSVDSEESESETSESSSDEDGNEDEGKTEVTLSVTVWTPLLLNIP